MTDGWGDAFGVMVPVLAFITLLIIAAMVDLKITARRAASRRPVMDGRFSGVEYGQYDEPYTTTSGAMVHVSHHHTRKVDVTVVRFDDGRTCILRGRRDITHPVGSFLVVDEDDNGHRHLRWSDPRPTIL